MAGGTIAIGVAIDTGAGITEELLQSLYEYVVSQPSAFTLIREIVATAKKKNSSETYSVYFLQDEAGIVRYVGRVKDRGYDARMAHHKRTRKLEPKLRISGLTYVEARGLEEIGIIECHTLNALNPKNNQIHGISPRNERIDEYLTAAMDYIYNRAENNLLNLLS